jgi:hypothetical protein
MSFREILSKTWSNIQFLLFPQLEKDVGELSELHKQLVIVLEFVRIEEFLSCTKFVLGRPAKHRAAIARAFIAKIIFKLQYTKQLRQLLRTDKQLRNICGWDSLNEIPSESKFSRAFKEFAISSLPDKVHQALIKDIYNGQIIGHIVKDSTPIEAREKPLKKGSAKERKKAKGQRRRREKAGELSRRQRQLQEKNLENMIQELPKNCDKGMKKSAQGYTKIWKGYKLHAAVDDNCVPLSVILTSASLHDCEAAIPLASKTQRVAVNFYDLMDAAYDHPEIREHSISLGHVPIIDYCPSTPEQKLEAEKEDMRKKILHFQTAEDKRYQERIPKERFNALFKDYYGGRNVFYRGHAKIFCHLMFGVLALTASQLVKMVN